MLLLVSIRIYLFLLLLLFGCDSPTNSGETLIFSGITETDSDGNIVGNIDSDDWCPFDMNVMDSGYGLNPIYPNPVVAQESGLGNSYKICYEYSSPYDSTFITSNHIYFDILSTNNDTIYNTEDPYSNGPWGSCILLPDTLVIDSIYRMHLTSDDWSCFGDIQFQ